jgi:hypothetical protein
MRTTMLTDKHGREIKVGHEVALTGTVGGIYEVRGGLAVAVEVSAGCCEMLLPGRVLAVVESDDAEPITEEWLVAEYAAEQSYPGKCRFAVENGSRTSMIVSWHAEYGVMLSNRDRLRQIKTRGQLRRLVAALRGE